MENSIDLKCGSCGAANKIMVPEQAAEDETISCPSCQHAMTTVGKVHALVAQEALGLGVDDLSDDHVPIGGPPFGETN